MFTTLKTQVYFDELASLYEIYKPFVASFLQAATKTLAALATKSDAAGHAYYSHGLDVISWLDGSVPRPPVEYLASIPLSLPLIGLTQLVQYLVVCKVADLTPGEIRSLFHGATGHSQGVVSAVCIAASDSFESFDTNAQKALKQLFYIGLRGQQFFPVLAIEPSIVENAVENGEGPPTPMLGVYGLQLKDLENQIKKTNVHLPAKSQLHVSLHNGSRNYVVTGPAKALYGLATALRSVKAPAGLDQGRIPFSKRKMVFSDRFLPIGVPFHSPYLAGATDKLIEEDLQGEELWSTTDLGVAVYNTETGADLRESTGSLTRSLCDQIFTSPIHWSKATDFPADATHAIDFGPGGASGIGPLTQRNLEGRGIRVLVVGDKGKSGAEAFSSGPLKYEGKWAEKFQPKLVKTL
jgi:fatty acid synthase subunit beta